VVIRCAELKVFYGSVNQALIIATSVCIKAVLFKLEVILRSHTKETTT